METWYYEVVSIDGDYANLRRTDIPSEDLKLVARALLPAEIMEGSRLKYELMQYEIVEGQRGTAKRRKIQSGAISHSACADGGTGARADRADLGGGAAMSGR